MAIYFRNQVTGQVGFWVINDGVLDAGDAYSLGVAPLDWSLVNVQNTAFPEPDGFSQDLIWQQQSTGVVGRWDVRAASEPGEIIGTFVPEPYVQTAPPAGFTSIGNLSGGVGGPSLGSSSNIWYNAANGAIVVTNSGEFPDVTGEDLSVAPLVDPAVPYLSGITAVLAQSTDTDWRPQIIFEGGIAGSNGGTPDDLTDDTAGIDGSVFVWRNTETNDVGIWTIGGEGGNEVNAQVIAEGVGAEWQIAGYGDFNDDSLQDILWQNSVTGEVGAWLLRNETTTVDDTTTTAVTFDAVSFGTAPAGWTVAGTGNYGGDLGTEEEPIEDNVGTDILFINEATGEVGFWDLYTTAEDDYAFEATLLADVGTGWEILPTYGLGNPVIDPSVPLS